MSETWRTVQECPRYEVSDTGRVRSRVHGGLRIMKPSLSSTGYPEVWLSPGDGSRLPRMVHRLVLMAFVGPPEPGHEVRHLNGVKTDNRLENLTYGTRSQNILDQVAHGAHGNASKTHCKRGHEFTPENTRYESSGDKAPRRRCVTCRSAAQRVYRGRAVA